MPSERRNQTTVLSNGEFRIIVRKRLGKQFKSVLKVGVSEICIVRCGDGIKVVCYGKC